MNIWKKITLGYKLGRDIINHPELRLPVKKAFTIDNVPYYEFVQPSDMPAARYMAMMDFMTERDLMITRKNLRELLEKQAEAMNAGKVTDAMIINADLQRMTEMGINFDAMYSIASCIYFNLQDNEDLFTYDFDYNAEKIEKFKKEKAVNFFLKSRMRRYLPYQDLSDGDFQTFLKLSEVNKRKIMPILNRDYAKKK